MCLLAGRPATHNPQRQEVGISTLKTGCLLEEMFNASLGGKRLRDNVAPDLKKETSCPLSIVFGSFIHGFQSPS